MPQDKDKVVVRKALLNDNDAIAKLSVSSWQKTYANILPADFLANLDWLERAAGRADFYAKNNDAAGFVVYDAGVLLGFCDSGAARQLEHLPFIDASYGEIYAIYVLEEAQQCGLGRALCQAACEHLMQQKFKHCVIWSLVDNTQALNFYIHNGCTPQPWRKRRVIDGNEYIEQAFTLNLF